MSVSSELNRIIDSKADIKSQVNIDKDLINQGNNFITNEKIDNYDDQIELMQEAYKKFIPIQTSSGTEITIDNSNNDKALICIELDGNTTQTTYNGYNLLPISSLSSTTTGDITFTNNNDGSYTLKGTASSYVGFTLFSGLDFNGTYTYVLKDTETSGLKMYLQTGTETVSSATYTTTDKNIKNIIIGIQAGTVITNLTIRPYVYSGNYDSSKTYEPYVGGTASPNPSYPQEVKVVTGANSIEIVGKNLFDKNNANILDNCVTGSAPALQEVEGCKTLYIPCKSNTTYTVSKVVSTRFIVCTTDTTPAIGVGTSVRSIDLTGTYITITTGASAKYLCVFYYYSATDTLTEQQILDTIMIEYGSTATTYQAYQRQSFSINLASKNLANNILGTTDKSAYAPVLTFDADLEPSTMYTISFKGTAGNKIYFNEHLFTSNAWNTEILNGVTSVTLTTKDTLDKTDLSQRNIYGRWIIVKNVQNQPNNNSWSEVQIEKRFDRYFL